MHIPRPGNILRFPWAAGEPPQSYRSCGVSPMPILPQESPYISGANMVIVLIFNSFDFSYVPTPSFVRKTIEKFDIEFELLDHKTLVRLLPERMLFFGLSDPD